MKIQIFPVIALLLLLFPVMAEAQHWTFNPHDYQYDMAIYFSLKNASGKTLSLANYEVAAFVGIDCRGVGKIENVATNSGTVTYGYVRIYSNAITGETVTFKYYDKSAGEEKEVAGTSVAFVSNDAVGLPSSPFVLVAEENVVITGDVNGDGRVDMVDMETILGVIANKKVTQQADLNVDGVVNVADIIILIGILTIQ